MSALFHIGIGLFAMWVAELEPRNRWMDSVCVVSGAANFGFAVAHLVVFGLVVLR
jgi:hypothetical protein